MSTEVLIIGAGPSGLVTALWLTKQGIKVRIIDRSERSVTTSRALALHARTLELYRQMELAEPVMEQAYKAKAMNLWADSVRAARVPFQDIGKGLSQFPAVYMFPQHEHEVLLEEKLKGMGVEVERSVELVGFTDGEKVEAHLSGPDGEEVVEAAYIVGCDGAHSKVRHTLDVGFEGGTYPQVFFVADVEGTGPVFNGEAHTDLNEADFLIVFPLDDNRRARLAGVISNQQAEHPEQLTFADVSHRAINSMNINVTKINWFSTYRVHHRVANNFRKGRAFLVGDAAHVHSPAGGQGMNTGIGDAINLSWKLAAVLRNRADPAILDSYEAERRPFAELLVKTTDSAFSYATSTTWTATFVRKWMVPYIVPLAMRVPIVPSFVFSRISQILLNYRQSPLAEGSAGSVCGGDRLPWAMVNGVDNHASLSNMTWKVHVYGSPSEKLAEWCKTTQIPLHIFSWAQEYQGAGLTRDVAYLLRPDTYIAAIDSAPEVLEKYVSGLGLVF